jgi:hypothetical protein
MPLPYNPNFEEPQPFRYLAPGLARFRIIQVEERQSESGNWMCVLTLHVVDMNGKKGTLYDYILPDKDYGAARIRDLLRAIDCFEDNGLGIFDGNKYLKKEGKIKLYYSKPKDKPEETEKLRFRYVTTKEEEEALMKKAMAEAKNSAKPMDESSDYGNYEAMEK